MMLAFFGMHSLFSGIYFIYWFRKNRPESLLRFSVVLFLPLLGYLLFVCLWLQGKLMIKQDPVVILSCEAYGCKTKNKNIKTFDVKRELNLVPMEEALLINSNYIKRKMILDLLKEDMGKYPKIIKVALNSQDSEASHYAATAVVELRRKMTLALQEGTKKYKKSGRDKTVLIAYANVLRECLNSEILDESNYKKVKEIYRALLEELLNNYGLEQKYYIDKITYDIEDRDYLSAQYYCQIFMNAHSQREEPYLLYLKLYYLVRDKSRFDAILEKLEDSSIVLTKEAWSTIKFWRKVNDLYG